MQVFDPKKRALEIEWGGICNNGWHSTTMFHQCRSANNSSQRDCQCEKRTKRAPVEVHQLRKSDPHTQTNLTYSCVLYAEDDYSFLFGAIYTIVQEGQGGEGWWIFRHGS